MLKLTIEKREGKLADVRKGGNIPGVFYGPKEAATSIAINEIEFNKIWKQAGESSIVTLQGMGEDHDALIHDIDRDPVKGNIRHVDFYVIEKGKKVQVNIPIEFVGVAPAIKELGGTLVKVLHEVEIEAMPKDLPHNLEVDISSLVDFDSQVKAADIKLPAGVTLLTDPEEVVVLAAAAKEEPEEPAAPVDISAIELSVEKGKKEEEEPAAE
ncbi:MAG: hypothetical protein RL094_286 [Candidatus Parcubacteria bacterium]|jgi:large subunit ribosomal protein L25